MSTLTETILEQTALDWFQSLGWKTAFGPDISPDLSALGLSQRIGGLLMNVKDKARLSWWEDFEQS